MAETVTSAPAALPAGPLTPAAGAHASGPAAAQLAAHAPAGVERALADGLLPDAPLAMPTQILEAGPLLRGVLLSALRMPFGLIRRPGH